MKIVDPTTPRCGLCFFWLLSPWIDAEKFESGAGGPNCDGTQSECRRHSPTGYDDNGRAKWPTTHRTDVCGDFVRRDPATSTEATK